MSDAITTLLKRNRQFADDFDAADLPILPKLNAMMLTCIDARVDPAHVFALSLGEVVTIRNNGGRVTPAVIDEIAAVSFMVAKMTGAAPTFDLAIVHHTQCGVERFADPDFQRALKDNTGVDVSDVAISDHDQSLHDDVQRLRDAARMPGSIVVSGHLYDVATGAVRQIIAPHSLRP